MEWVGLEGIGPSARLHEAKFQHPGCSSNVERAEWARITMDAFADVHGQQLDTMDPESILEVVGDFVADLLHFLDRTSVEWEDIWDRANLHYSEEIRE